MTASWRDDARIIRWQGGDWSLELRDDEIADITFRGRCVLRSVRAIVRDHDWNTARWVIERRDAGDAGIELGLRSEGYGADLRATLHLAAGADGLDIAFAAQTASAFRTNRTGLVVLHPPVVAGVGATVTHPDGESERTAFPRAISPHQPMRDIAALAWQVDGLALDLRFAGDVFEMEDQRNWTDASFKTYSRPLSLPFPYALDAGEWVHQSLALTVREIAAPPAPADGDVIELTASGPFPEMWVGAATTPEAGGLPDAAGVLVELDLRAANWRAALARAARGADALDVRVVVPDAAPLADLAAALVSLPVVRIAAYDTVVHVSDTAVVAELRRALADVGLEIPVIGGARSHFTELNREQGVLSPGLDALTFSTTPLFHSLDTEQLVESVAMQRLVAAQAVGIAGGRPVDIGPITLRPRFNDVATAPAAQPVHEDLREGYGAHLLAADDQRQASDELGAWVVAATAAMAVPGIRSLVWFEQSGPRGLVTDAGEQTPAASAFAALHALRGRPALVGDSPDGLLWAIGAEQPDGAVRVLAANLDARGRTVEVAAAGRRATVPLAAGAWAELTL